MEKINKFMVNKLIILCDFFSKKKLFYVILIEEFFL